MCGIAGIIDFRGRPIEEAILRHFNRCLAHRGPDDSGIFIHQSAGFSAGLAHTRLAVIDPTPEAHQPMIAPGGRCVITYNGELYNYRALRDQLTVRPRTQSDTEVVLAALHEWGPAALHRFDGMWALAFLLPGERTGHISRDPFGIKPLFYAVDDDRLIFASELHAIRMTPGLKLEIDQEGLGSYLNLGFIPHPYTIYRQIRKLPPGHLLRFDANGAREPERYFHLDRAGGEARSAVETSYPEAVREVRRLTIDAVQQQRIADVPLGAFLSGGLDSAVVVACLSQTGASPVQTFSIGYADHARYDETRYAQIVAERLGTRHHAFQLTFGDILETIEPVLGSLGEPFADSSILPATLVSRYTREHVTVALSGDGGDELFGGYWRYLAHDYLERYQRLPQVLRSGVIEPLLRRAPSARSSRMLDRLRQARKLLRGVNASDALGRHLAWARWIEPATAAALLGAEPARQAWSCIDSLYRSAAGELISAPTPGPAGTSLEDVLLADLALGLPADMLFKVDTASMIHSLEVRVPLLAPDLAGFVARLPIEYRIERGAGKRILRDAFRDLLPAEILERPKMGFEVPIGEFLHCELRDFYQSHVTRDVLEPLGINAAAAGRLYEEHLHRREDHADALWALLVLSYWSRATHQPSREAG